MPQEYIGTKVEKMLRSLGGDQIKKVMEKVGKKPCGCGGRRDKLNKWHQNVLKEIDNIKKNL